MTESIERQNAIIVDHVQRSIAGAVAVYRFGSTARGEGTRSSDIDIAVLSKERMRPEHRFDVQEALAAAVGCDVDLVDLAGASPVLAIQVIAEGQLLHDGDTEARGLFEDCIFSAYARLNEERRGILERIAAEGTVYGR